MTKQPEFDPLVDELPSRYVVGIDLGTTNSAVAYVDTEESPWRLRVFPVPQLVAADQVEARETLPSFHYQPTAAVIAGGSLKLPWNDRDLAHAVGFYARDEGTKTPGRLIASAKSWLCHSGVDRTAELLPWQGADDVEQLSPIEVTSRYLRHIRDAWNHRFSQDPLAEQQLVITLPASFDEVARELTVQAAADAELPRVVLIEEPQAAFYAWVDKHAETWQQFVEPGQRILVCDIGGGTSDFTLIRVSAGSDEAGQEIQFHRVAVGEHLILGGDNLDLALAHHVEALLAKESPLTPQQWDVLVLSARRAKETLLGDEAPERLTINLPGAGSKLIGGGRLAEVKAVEVQQLLVDGFLPEVKLAEKPTARASGFQEFGLPYAADHAITRYLAAFLTAHRHTGSESVGDDHDVARPDIVLFNGGFFASSHLRDRLLKVLGSWFRTAGDDWSPQVLDNDRLDLAVARGAAYYGMVQRGDGVRIAANLARSYYIGLEGDETTAVCLVPGDAQPGHEVESLETTFELTISKPVEFPLYVSSTRLTDRPGDIVPIEREQLKPLPPIRTVLQGARRSERGSVPVELHARLTEIGTIDLWCAEVGKGRRWRLQFDIRSATQTDVASHESAAESEGFVDEATWQTCHELVADVFAPDGRDDPAGLMKRLTAALETGENQWPTSLLRRVWEALMEFEPGRRRSAAHEARWLNLLGYALRPGYGFAVDDWRVAETWRAVRGKLAKGSFKQSLILWRRLAGGLSRGRQLAIAEPSLAAIRVFLRRFQGGGQRGGDSGMSPDESAEVWRLLASLELLPVSVKVELGNAIVDLMPRRKLQKVRSAMVWALGRLGQRVPVYGPLNTVVPRDTAAQWLEALLKDDRGEQVDFLAAMQLARRTNDRHRDLPEPLRQRCADWITSRDGSAHFAKLVQEGGRLDQEEQGQVFGEALPRGLRMR